MQTGRSAFPLFMPAKAAPARLHLAGTIDFSTFLGVNTLIDYLVFDFASTILTSLMS